MKKKHRNIGKVKKNNRNIGEGNTFKYMYFFEALPGVPLGGRHAPPNVPFEQQPPYRHNPSAPEYKFVRENTIAFL